MGWGIKDLGIAGITMAVLAIGVLPVLIIIGIALAAGIVTAFITGWLNTIIYTLAGVGVSWFISLFGAFRNVWSHTWTLLFLLIIPVMAFIGWGVNHTSYLSMMPNPLMLIATQQPISLGLNDVNGAPVTFTLSFELIGWMMFLSGLLLAFITAAVLKKSRKRHR